MTNIDSTSRCGFMVCLESCRAQYLNVFSVHLYLCRRFGGKLKEKSMENEKFLALLRNNPSALHDSEIQIRLILILPYIPGTAAQHTHAGCPLQSQGHMNEISSTSPLPLQLSPLTKPKCPHDPSKDWRAPVRPLARTEVPMGWHTLGSVTTPAQGTRAGVQIREQQAKNNNTAGKSAVLPTEQTRDNSAGTDSSSFPR